MARYIDLEELEKRLHENIKPENLEEKALIEWCKDECIRQAYAMPIADVAPKSEKERPMFENTRNILLHLKRQIHDKAVYAYDGIEPYISIKVFDAVINKLVEACRF